MANYSRFTFSILLFIWGLFSFDKLIAQEKSSEDYFLMINEFIIQQRFDGADALLAYVKDIFPEEVERIQEIENLIVAKKQRLQQQNDSIAARLKSIENTDQGLVEYRREEGECYTLLRFLDNISESQYALKFRLLSAQWKEFQDLGSQPPAALQQKIAELAYAKEFPGPNGTRFPAVSFPHSDTTLKPYDPAKYFFSKNEFQNQVPQDEFVVEPKRYKPRSHLRKAVAAFSPTGDVLLTYTGQTDLMLWTTAGKLIKKIAVSPNSSIDYAFHPHLPFFLLYQDGQLSIYETSGKEVISLSSYDGFAFEPHLPRIWVFSKEKDALLYDFEGKVKKRVGKKIEDLDKLSISPGGKYLLFLRQIDQEGDIGAISLYSTEKHKSVDLNIPDQKLLSFAFSANDQFVSLQFADILQVWNLEEKQLNWESPASPYHSVMKWNPLGDRLLLLKLPVDSYGEEYGEVKYSGLLAEVRKPNGARVDTFVCTQPFSASFSTRIVLDAQFAPDGRSIVISNSFEGFSSIFLWQEREKKAIRISLPKESGYFGNQGIAKATFSENSRYLLCFWGSRKAFIYNLSGELLRSFQHMGDQADYVPPTWSPDGNSVLTLGLRSWDLIYWRKKFHQSVFGGAAYIGFRNNNVFKTDTFDFFGSRNIGWEWDTENYVLSPRAPSDSSFLFYSFSWFSKDTLSWKPRNQNPSPRHIIHNKKTGGLDLVLETGEKLVLAHNSFVSEDPVARIYGCFSSTGDHVFVLGDKEGRIWNMQGELIAQVEKFAFPSEYARNTRLSLSRNERDRILLSDFASVFFSENEDYLFIRTFKGWLYWYAMPHTIHKWIQSKRCPFPRLSSDEKKVFQLSSKGL